MAALRTALTLLIGFLLLSKVVRADQPEKNTERRYDLYGDRLPDGAIARIGTVRLRHTDNAVSLAYSPEGQLLASGGSDNVICLWEANSGKEVRRLTGSERWLSQLCFSPDGRVLAAASHHAEVVQVWNVSDGKQLFRLKGGCVAFAPDGKSLATGCKDNLIRFWESSTGKELRQFAGHIDEVRCLAFAPNGKMLASGGKDKTVCIWSVANANILHKIKDYQNGVQSISFATDGERIVIGSNGAANVYNAGTGAHIHDLASPKEGIGAILFSPDGTTIAATSDRRGIRRWDAATGRQLRDLTSASWHFDESVGCLAISPDGKQLACATGNRFRSNVIPPRGGSKFPGVAAED
jgi:WD40 repeat protein